MGRRRERDQARPTGRAQARPTGRARTIAAEGIMEALVFAILLFLALLILGLIFSGFGVIFGAGNSFLFALAYFVARVSYPPVAAAVSAQFES